MKTRHFVSILSLVIVIGGVLVDLTLLVSLGKIMIWVGIILLFLTIIIRHFNEDEF